MEGFILPAPVAGAGGGDADPPPGPRSGHPHDSALPSPSRRVPARLPSAAGFFLTRSRCPGSCGESGWRHGELSRPVRGTVFGDETEAASLDVPRQWHSGGRGARSSVAGGCTAQTLLF